MFKIARDYSVQNGVEVFVGVCCVHDGIVLRGCLIEVLEVLWCYLMLCCVNCWEIVLNLVSLLLLISSVVQNGVEVVRVCCLHDGIVPHSSDINLFC